MGLNSSHGLVWKGEANRHSAHHFGNARQGGWSIYECRQLFLCVRIRIVGRCLIILLNIHILRRIYHAGHEIVSS